MSCALNGWLLVLIHEYTLVDAAVEQYELSTLCCKKSLVVYRKVIDYLKPAYDVYICIICELCHFVHYSNLKKKIVKHAVLQ